MSSPPSISSQRSWQAISLTALTLGVLLVHGYHPLAEDGGLYVAGVLWTLDPTLFPHTSTFVTAHLRFSVFAPTLAGAVRLTHLPLPAILLLTYLSTTTLTLYAATQIARRCLSSRRSQWHGVALLAAWWTLPVAATSLLLMDPYLTARSVSLPFSLLAIAFALHEPPTTHSLALCTFSLAIAAAFHPLMAAYALALIVALLIVRSRRPKLGSLLFIAVACATAATLQALAPPESPALLAAQHSRYYWFLSQWHWYEFLGLLAPLAIFATLARSKRLLAPARSLCRAVVLAGSAAALVALVFAHESSATHLVARLQPLRVFVLAYALMALLLGALCADWVSESPALPGRFRRHLPKSLIALVAMAMFFVQRSSFSASPHLELPSITPTNPWVQAFLWARRNTPRDALFALDARYVNTPGEDAQTFRATALRDALPDFSKDGGEASITPALAAAWLESATAQKDLSTQSDASRDARLKPLGATWMVLAAGTPTEHPCPYTNTVVKVCRLVP